MIRCPACGEEDYITVMPFEDMWACDTCENVWAEGYAEFGTPPIRRSKSSRPTHTRDGDSVKNIQRLLGKRARK